MSSQVGEVKTPSLQATEAGLRRGADQATQILANPSPQAIKSADSGNHALVLKLAEKQNGAIAACAQIVWISFFFDGTGNNREADLTFSKHSNIVRLYRAHKPTDFSKRLFSVYIPGVGTYFPEIGDEGGGDLGLGCGAMGEARLDFAIKQFDTFLGRPVAQARSPANAIQEINLAVFGFSRGAALARAFLNMLMEKRCERRQGRWVLRDGSWPIRFRFLGLFDTVASVGLPMSWNNTALVEAKRGDTAGMMRKRLLGHPNTSPQELAFFSKTSLLADPAPGNQHGHSGWGERLKIHESVEEVRHFIAAHEIRNSFPLDSISVLQHDSISKPSNFYEIIYPGAHSDVGGGYAPGEGGKAVLPDESLSLIPLRHMYDCASRAGVPMLAEWSDDNKSDFRTDSMLVESYNAYQKAVGSFANLGDGINKHMAMYYAWRFRSIRIKAAGDKAEAKLIQAQDNKFRKNNEVLAKKLDDLVGRENVSLISLNALKEVQDMRAVTSEGSSAYKSLSVKDSDVEEAQKKYENAHDERLKMKAKKDTLPNMRNLLAMLELYDQQLLADVLAIQNALHQAIGNKKRSDLRPHYKLLLQAYVNEFENNNGLKDEKVIIFFDRYVHDSLAGFGKDATLPSDPRVVYLGGNEKLRYAGLNDHNLLNGEEKRLA